MFKMKSVMLVGVFFMCLGGISSADVLDFEDIVIHNSPNSGPLQDNYGGFSWDGPWRYINNSYHSEDIVIGDYGVVSHNFRYPYDIISENNSPFTWNGAEFCMENGTQYGNGDTINVYGSLNSLVTHWATITLNLRNPTWFNAEWENVDTISIDGSDSHSFFVMDNFTFNEDSTPSAPVPEPATMLLFGTGMAGMATIRRFKNKK